MQSTRCPVEARDNERIRPRYKGTFLAADKVIGKNRVKYVFCETQVQDVMPLYAYGEAKMQMITVPRSLLKIQDHVDGKVQKTTERIILTHYMLHELEIIRNENNAQNERVFYPYNKDKDKSFQVFGILEIDWQKLSKSKIDEKAREIYYMMADILRGWDTYLTKLPYLHDKSAGEISMEECLISITKEHFMCEK